MFLWRKHLTLGFFSLFLFFIYWVIFSIMGGPHMVKYFIASLLFWGFAPIASIFILLFFILGLIGYGGGVVFTTLQWWVPWGLPVIFARFFIILLLFGCFLYLITIFFRLILICFDNGFRGTGFVLIAIFFLIRAFFRYYSAGIFIQGVIVLLYEALIELISLFFLFYWSLKRRFLKRQRIYFKYKEEDVGFFIYSIGKFMLFILNFKYFRKKESYDYYRRSFGWFCYVYELRKLVEKHRKAGTYISFAEERYLLNKYINTSFYVDDSYSEKLEKDRDYLFIVLELMEDEEPEIWREETKRLF